MSPDIMFFLILALKIALAVLIVIIVTVSTERAGAVIGAFLATLPVSAGPAYILLALDHNAAFLSDSAIFTMVMNSVNALFALLFVFLAQNRSLLVSTIMPIGAWFVLAFLARNIPWTVTSAVIVNVAVMPFCYWFSRPYRDAVIPRLPLRAIDIAFRAGVTALIALTIVTLSFQLGPSGSGVLAVFPVIYVSLILLMQKRIGGRAAAAVAANGFRGMPGFAIAALALHYAAAPIGKWAALLIALAIGVGWNIAVFGLSDRRRRQLPA